MNVGRQAARIGADVGRWTLAMGRWLLESLRLLLRGWVPFFFRTKRGLIVGLVLVGFFIAVDETPGAQGPLSIVQLSSPDLYASVALELFIIAVGVRLASGFRNRARRAGWIRFLASWSASALVYGLVVSGIPRFASTGGYDVGRFQISAAAGLALAVLAAGAINNWAALARILALERSDSTARATRRRILNAVARRPLPAPSGAAYSVWYAWAICALSASPAAAHRAAEAAVSALRSGAGPASAADAARRSRWTPAGVVDRLRPAARGTA